MTTAIVAALVAVVAAVVIGPIGLPVRGVVGELLDHLPVIEVSSGLRPIEAAIVSEVRLPRALVAFVVGSLLATSGGAYQAVFRNPLADPYLLGVASGAGLGATVAIVGSGVALGTTPGAVPVAAFAGALGAVGLTYLLGARADRLRSNASLILAGVAVAALCS
ncbi:MAG: iron chelate uptake ABC transporter family permease subunit, partial [Acidimicrobiales bacterium]|nr:iron chelate uptake ABC transporter family permease subunit [Acidimicrobiales bacterium]